MKIKDYYANPLVKLNEATHEYYWTATNEIIQGPSITKLIEVIYPFKIKDIPADALKAGIEKGVCVHNRLSEYIKAKDDSKCQHTYNGWPIQTHTKEYLWIKEQLANVSCQEIYSEVSLSNGRYNGTFDLLYLDHNNKWHLVDFKTTARLNKAKEILQLKFYEQLITDIFEDIPEIDYYEIYNSKNQEHYTFDDDLQKQAEFEKAKIMNESEFSELFKN
ncbi:PD-(D/E)XK nuclease family protein [Mesoplasma seiffertii]|uniref:PD-(D/E)XK nuclease family protein n=1 Tax=Mesoplasma seiffertii TaxID=28224 RepID=UPI00047AEBC8|nr:PD-(D/E)XK nuclease family protein [Mesoplasma seiffertii]